MHNVPDNYIYIYIYVQSNDISYLTSYIIGQTYNVFYLFTTQKN